MLSIHDDAYETTWYVVKNPRGINYALQQLALVYTTKTLLAMFLQELRQEDAKYDRDRQCSAQLNYNSSCPQIINMLQFGLL